MFSGRSTEYILILIDLLLFNVN